MFVVGWLSLHSIGNGKFLLDRLRRVGRMIGMNGTVLVRMCVGIGFCFRIGT
jgi:hypothetical protein